MLAKVPTAPETLPTLMTSRARSIRSRARPISSYQSAIFSPKVTGSAWTPWDRADHDRILVLQRLFPERLAQRGDVVDDDIRRAAHEPRQRCVQHIGRGEPQVDIARIGADLLADGCQERDDVVLHDLLEFIDALDLEVGAFLDDGQRLLRDQAQSGVRFTREDLDGEPGAVAVLGFPESGSFRLCCSEGSFVHVLLLSIFDDVIRLAIRPRVVRWYAVFLSSWTGTIQNLRELLVAGRIGSQQVHLCLAAPVRFSHTPHNARSRAFRGKRRNGKKHSRATSLTPAPQRGRNGCRNGSRTHGSNGHFVRGTEADQKDLLRRNFSPRRDQSATSPRDPCNL